MDPQAGALGTVRTDGIPRNAVFTLSGKIRARLTGQSTVQFGGRSLTYEIWSIEGSAAATPSGKKEYYFEIDEDNNIIDTPTS